METIKVALLGLGTVGTGVYRTIESHQQYLQSVLGASVEVKAILIQDQAKSRSVDIDPSVFVTTDINAIFELPQLDVVIEMIGGLEPARGYIIEALSKGYHVITANKELMAYHGSELKNQAQLNGVKLTYEASVAGAIPIIRTLNQLLQVNQIRSIEGIINGTSNFILSRMREKQCSFEEALKDAQKAGYAEADPKNDIEGWDAFYKLMIISELVLEEQPDWSLVKREGIETVSGNDIQIANEFGLRIKLIASLKRFEKGWVAKVEPVFIDSVHPLYKVEGVDNALSVETDVAGRLFFQGPGAGSLPTASAIIEDLVDLWQHRERSFIVPKEGFKENKVYLNQEHGSYWLFLLSHPHPFNQVEQKRWENGFAENDLVLQKNKTINDSERGFISGCILFGTRDQMNNFITQIKGYKAKYYPISGWDENSLLESVEKEAVLL